MSADPFVREAREDVRRLSEGLVELESEGADRERVDELFRRAHSLKGSLGMEGYDDASDLAHALEDLLDAVRAGEIDPEGEVVDRGLDAVDGLDAALDEVQRGEEPDAHEAAVASLREAVAERTPDEADAEETAEDPDIDAVLAEAEAETADEEMTAEEALDAVSGFDDLDALAAEVDEEEAEAYEGLSGGGALPGDDGDGAAPDPDASGEAGVGGDEVFASVVAEVDDDDTSMDELEAEIAAESFGEFDDDDDMSIDDLVEIDPDEEPPAEVEPPAAGETVDAEAEATDDEASEPEPSAEVEAEETTETSAVGSESEFAWVRESVEVEHEIERLDAEIADESFGEFDDDDGMTIEELVDIDPDEEPPHESALGEPVVDPAASVDAATGADEADVSADADEGTDPAAPDAETRIEPSASAEETDDAETRIEPSAPAEETDDAETDPVSALAADLDADRDEVAAVAADLSDERGVPVADLDPETVEAELAAAEEELADIEAELDEVELGADEPTADTPGGESGFERDSELEAFESRFEGMFEGGGETTGRSVAVGTLADSSVDPSVYERDRPTDERELTSASDVQSLTVDVENADELLSLVEELSVHARRLNEELAARPAADPVSRALGELESTTRDLQRTVMDVRLMPLSTVTDGLSRVVRDVTREGDVEASLVVEGEDVRLDRSIIDRLGDPIVHLVRNAVDHGIESPDEREAAGKPREGTVELRARRDGNEVVVEVADDGAGVDADEVFDRAVERDLVDADADLPESEVLEFLFHPGFSTTEAVTKTSGRGVGMDVVREVTEALNGDVTVETTVGEGTTVSLRLPVSVATLEVLFVEAGGERYALPADAVEHVGREGGARIAGGTGEGLLTPESVGTEIDLARAMGVGETGPDAAAVRVAQADGSATLRCDRVLNTRNVVVDPYDDLLAEVPMLTGTTMTDDGRLVNVVDVDRMEDTR